MRHRSAYAREKGWVDATASAPGSPFDWFSNFSRLLLKGFEHTWGLRYDMCYGERTRHSIRLTASKYKS